MFRVSKVTKRDGRIFTFNETKIANAISKAINAVGKKNKELVIKVTVETVKFLNEKFEDQVPNVEDIQDLVEKVLIKKGYAEVAKAYILYRQKRTEIREQKQVPYRI